MMRVFERYFSTWRGLPAAMLWLSAGWFVWNAGQTAVAFMAVYFIQQHGLSATDAGLVLGAAGAGRLLAVLPSGWLADRLDIRRLLVLTMAAQALTFVPMPFVSGFLPLALASFGMGFFEQALRPAALAAIQHICPPQDRLRAYSLNRMATNAGLTAGSAFGGLVYGLWPDGIFWVNALACLAATLLLLKMPPVRAVQAAAKPGEPLAASPWRDGVFLGFIGILTVSLTIFMLFRSVLPTDLVERQGIAPATFGLLVAANCFAVFALEVPVLAILRRWPGPRLATIGSVIVALGYGQLAFLEGLPGALLWVTLWTLGEMALLPAVMAMMQVRAARGQAGVIMALYSMSFTLGATIGPLAGGWLLDHAGAPMLWGLSGLTGLAASAGILVLGRRVVRG